MGANYSFYVKTIETHASAFFKVIIFSISSVDSKELATFTYIFNPKPKTNLPVQLAVELQFYQHCPERHHQYWSLYQYCN